MSTLVAALRPRSAEITALLAEVGEPNRHRRNLRAHNPAAYKARALGNLRVNGEPLPVAGHF